jgi:hypothetical protein
LVPIPTLSLRHRIFAHCLFLVLCKAVTGLSFVIVVSLDRGLWVLLLIYPYPQFPSNVELFGVLEQ